jgi:antitoxin (DNA-binding transcriptional repressor) of toxin-antitoxin stability system
VAQGERVVITRDGHRVAELGPLSAHALSGAQLLERWRHVPVIDADVFRADVDEAVDSRL